MRGELLGACQMTLIRRGWQEANLRSQLGEHPSNELYIQKYYDIIVALDEKSQMEPVEKRTVEKDARSFL